MTWTVCEIRGHAWLARFEQDGAQVIEQCTRCKEVRSR